MTPPPLLPAFTPVPREKDRSNGWKPEVQRAFIEALADTGSVKAACRRVGRSEHGVYQLRRHPEAEEFRAAWEAALKLGVQRLEDVAMDRALNGVDVPVYSYGKLVGLRKSYNDRLLMFMLRNRAPERFAEGRPKALNAMDLTRLEQEKKKWRKEWELERAAELEKSRIDPARARQVIDDKMEELRQRAIERHDRMWEQLSEETKEAWERFEALKARDLSCAQVAGGGSAQKVLPPVLSPKLPEPEEPETGPKVRRLKDEGWD